MNSLYIESDFNKEFPNAFKLTSITKESIHNLTAPRGTYYIKLKDRSNMVYDVVLFNKDILIDDIHNIEYVYSLEVEENNQPVSEKLKDPREGIEFKSFLYMLTTQASAHISYSNPSEQFSHIVDAINLAEGKSNESCSVYVKLPSSDLIYNIDKNDLEPHTMDDYSVVYVLFDKLEHPAVEKDAFNLTDFMNEHGSDILIRWDATTTSNEIRDYMVNHTVYGTYKGDQLIYKLDSTSFISEYTDFYVMGKLDSVSKFYCKGEVLSSPTSKPCLTQCDECKEAQDNTVVWNAPKGIGKTPIPLTTVDIVEVTTPPDTINTVWDLKLHQSGRVSKCLWVTRVPGGWIYQMTSGYEVDYPLFVPFTPQIFNEGCTMCGHKKED